MGLPKTQVGQPRELVPLPDPLPASLHLRSSGGCSGGPLVPALETRGPACSPQPRLRTAAPWGAALQRQHCSPTPNSPHCRRAGPPRSERLSTWALKGEPGTQPGATPAVNAWDLALWGQLREAGAGHGPERAAPFLRLCGGPFPFRESYLPLLIPKPAVDRPRTIGKAEAPQKALGAPSLETLRSSGHQRQGTELQ